MIYIGIATIITAALIIRKLIDKLFDKREPKGLRSDKVIIGNGWGI